MHNIPLLNKCFNEINPLICGWQSCDKGHFFGPASREYYLIHYIVSGNGIFERAGKRYTLYKDCMFLIRPYELTFYKADNENPWEYIWIGFNGSLIADLLKNGGFSDDICTMHIPSLKNIFLSMKDAENMQHSSELYLCGKIFEIFSYLSEEFSPTPKGSTASVYCKRAKDYIMSNYATQISVESIAKMLGIDRRYLCRIFHKHTGNTPQNFIVNYRLEKAALLLSKHGYTVAEAGRSTGYDDVYNFSKMFKKKFGIPPSRYKGDL